MLAIPARLTRDLAQLQLGDEPSVTRGEKQNVFLDRRRQMHQNHDLRKARRGNVTQARKLGVAGDRARSHQRVEFVRQRQKPRFSRRSL